jgi:hypothetical protein
LIRMIFECLARRLLPLPPRDSVLPSMQAVSTWVGSAKTIPNACWMGKKPPSKRATAKPKAVRTAENIVFTMPPCNLGGKQLKILYLNHQKVKQLLILAIRRNNSHSHISLEKCGKLRDIFLFLLKKNDTSTGIDMSADLCQT